MQNFKDMLKVKLGSRGFRSHMRDISPSSIIRRIASITYHVLACALNTYDFLASGKMHAHEKQ